MNLFAHAKFSLSVGRLDQLPHAGLPEVAFAGRSNVGKSSAINALTARRRLAFFSKTPGRTQTINFYDLGGAARLVDLPGYGYARVPDDVRRGWDRLVGGYLAHRKGLVGLVLVMDARHPLTPGDAQLIDWLRPILRDGVRLAVLLAKSDKLSRTERAATVAVVERRLGDSAVQASVRLFSSASGEGVEDAGELLQGWLREAGAALPAPEIKSPRQRGVKPGAKRLNLN